MMSLDEYDEKLARVMAGSLRGKLWWLREEAKVFGVSEGLVVILLEAVDTLAVIGEWDMLNPPQGDVVADLPAIKEQIDDALEKVEKGIIEEYE